MATLHENDDDEQGTSNEEHVDLPEEKVVQKDPDVEVIEDDGADERIGQGDEEETDTDEGDAPRRKRETAAERRNRAKLAKERDKRELDFQRREISRQDQELRELRQAVTVTRVNDIDTRIATANNEAAQFDRIFAAAITAKNGEDARQAAEYRDAAKTRAWQLDQERQRIAQEAKTPRNQAPPYQGQAEDFMAANPWYDHTGRDADSRLVKEIDAAVAKEYIPTSPAYWAELQRRVEKNLPHKFESRQRQQRNNDDDGDDDTQEQQQRQDTRRRGPPTGGSSRSNSSTSQTQIRLSPERVQAMKDAGLWDDPKTRTKMAKQYANYDKQNSRG